jgi:hypothetical protein
MDYNVAMPRRIMMVVVVAIGDNHNDCNDDKIRVIIIMLTGDTN